MSAYSLGEGGRTDQRFRGGDFLAEAHHRIANSLTLLVALVSSRARQLGSREQKLEPAEAASLLGDVSARIAAVGSVHRILTRIPDGSHVDVGQHLVELSETIVSSLAEAGQFRLITAVDDTCAVSPDTAISLSLCVAELLTNSIKYAHPAGAGGTITLVCRKSAHRDLEISVIDDGVGLPEGFDAEAGGNLGFRTIRSLASRAGATMRVESGPLGLAVTLLVEGGC
ncbi:MAG: sensor histidine kinase [Bauldia sp.]